MKMPGTPSVGEGAGIVNMTRLEKEIKNVAKNSSSKKTKKTGGRKKSGSGIEKTAKKLLK
jgi:hypothetical protein